MSQDSEDFLEQLKAAVDAATKGEDSPISKLVLALQSDPGYWEAWKANIAMAFKDEYERRFTNVGRWAKPFADCPHLLHEISNQAAENFLQLLCKPTQEKPNGNQQTRESNEGQSGESCTSRPSVP